MVQQSPVDIVRELWARFERDGVEAALGLVDEDVVYLLQLAGGRVLHGSGEVRRLFADFEARGVSLEARLDTLEQRGDAVVASGTVRTQRPDGLQEAQYTPPQRNVSDTLGQPMPAGSAFAHLAVHDAGEAARATG